MCRYWIQATVDRALADLIRLRRLNIGACNTWLAAASSKQNPACVHTVGSLPGPFSPGRIFNAMAMYHAGDKLRICGAELQSHAAGSPLQACSTARLKICRNNTFRRACTIAFALCAHNMLLPSCFVKLRGMTTDGYECLLQLFKSSVCRVSQEARLGACKSVASSWVPLSAIRAEGGTLSRTLVVRISQHCCLHC
jgi:hypothetical protein